MKKKSLLVLLLLTASLGLYADDFQITDKPVRVIVSSPGESTIRISILPENSEIPYNPVVEHNHSGEIFILENFDGPEEKKFSSMQVRIEPTPFRIIVKDKDGRLIQEIVARDDGNLQFRLDDKPVLGMGEGGPRVGREWRDMAIEFDRNGRLHKMEPRWQGNSYGSRNPVPLLIGTAGWGIFVAEPWVQVDMTENGSGVFIPRESLGLESSVQGQRDQQSNSGKGIPPPESYVPGLFDFFIFDTSDPILFYEDLAGITGKSVMPPLWSLGYMQSHRTLEDEDQMLDIVKTFREKKIPVDAVIYLGTGFCPRGWNTQQPSFDFNPEVFKSSPSEIISSLHNLDVKVAVHIVPWDRDGLPTLTGSIPPAESEEVSASHILNYWNQHTDLVNSGIDAWWPDEGDWFNLWERIKRHQLYYQGPLYSTPNVRPWSLHRNGYLGISKWGGWVWSGDTESSWKTLEGQIAVGINHSLSLSPYWGSDIGGFYPSEELDGELYARWFQFGAFCPSFRSHGRTWWTRLPWGWGLSEMGPLENRRNPLESELNNPVIESVCRKYSNLRYSLLTYNYSLAWEAREKGLPFMRAMWIHYPEDVVAAGMGDQYLWGDKVIIAPVYEKGAVSRELYLPQGKWYDWWNNNEYSGGQWVNRSVDLETLPLFVKAGAIIPIDPVRQYTGEDVEDNITLRIYSGADGQTTIFQDDGISLDYLDGKGYSILEMEWDDSERVLNIERESTTDTSSVNETMEFNILLLPEGLSGKIRFTGRSQDFKVAEGMIE